jgi:hypothetical protein
MAATHREYGLGYCIRCFVEAREHADTLASERVIRRLRGR